MAVDTSDAFAAEDSKDEAPKSCENIRVRGQGVRQTVDRVKKRADALCGPDGKSGKVMQAAKKVNEQLDKCVDTADEEYSISLRNAFEANQYKRATEICQNLKKDLDTVDQFCERQGQVRSTAKSTIESTITGDAGARPRGDATGQYQLHDRLASAHSVAHDSAKRFHGLTEKLKKSLESRRRKGEGNSDQSASSIDDLMRRQEQFFLQAPQRRAQLFKQRAQEAQRKGDTANARRLYLAAKACQYVGSSRSPVIQFRKAMENNLLPNQENLYRMSSEIEKQAKADIDKTGSELAKATSTRDRFKTDLDKATQKARVKGEMPRAEVQPRVTDMSGQPIKMRDNSVPITLKASPKYNVDYVPAGVRYEKLEGYRIPVAVEYYKYNGKIYRYIRK